MKKTFARISATLMALHVLSSMTLAQNSFDLDGLWKPIRGRRCRASSYQRDGENRDYLSIASGARAEFLHVEGPSGCIQRIWMTIAADDPAYLRKVKISMAFDGQVTVDSVPIGFFTGTGPWRVNDLTTPVLNVMRSRQGNRDQEGTGAGSFNMCWPMPFENEAKIEVFNGSQSSIKQFFHIDYVERRHDEAPLLFHATYNVKSPTAPADRPRTTDVDSNYVLLNAHGYRGRYVGTLLCVESHPDRRGKWYEGDDMFVIDGEAWPPRLHGTGTEDYFGMAWGCHRRYQAFDHGVSHYERNLTDHDRFFDGRFVLYRWHLVDPIVFEKSLHASIEAGHANECEQHYESLAFWYGLRLQASP